MLVCARCWLLVPVPIRAELQAAWKQFTAGVITAAQLRDVQARTVEAIRHTSNPSGETQRPAAAETVKGGGL
jgi:hypothetical protein